MHTDTQQLECFLLSSRETLPQRATKNYSLSDRELEWIHSKLTQVAKGCLYPEENPSSHNQEQERKVRSESWVKAKCQMLWVSAF